MFPDILSNEVSDWSSQVVIIITGSTHWPYSNNYMWSTDTATTTCGILTQQQLHVEY